MCERESNDGLRQGGGSIVHTGTLVCPQMSTEHNSHSITSPQTVTKSTTNIVHLCVPGTRNIVCTRLTSTLLTLPYVLDHICSSTAWLPSCSAGLHHGLSLTVALDLQALRKRGEGESYYTYPGLNLHHGNLPVLIELTMMSEDRVSELRWARNVLSDRRLIISGTSSSSESDDW